MLIEPTRHNITRRTMLLIALLNIAACAMACTSAIVSAGLTRDGRPLLWKNRDTGTTDNFIAKVEGRDGSLTYIALYNAGDSALAEAWMGMNEAGFAIMNTASYNLMPDTAKFADQEGRVMTLALSRCRNLADFEHLLDTLPKPMGVQANFGVIDATGDGAYYETDDFAYMKYSLKDSENGIIIRTNFSVSGQYDTGKGYVRYDNAEFLLREPITERSITPETFTDGLSRSFYHAAKGCDMSAKGQKRILDTGEFIPRYSTSASVVIEGVLPGDNPSDMVMWTEMGYPPVAHTQAVTFDKIPQDLLPDSKWHSPESDAAAIRKRSVFKLSKDGKKKYIDIPRMLSINAQQRSISRENYRQAGK